MEPRIAVIIPALNEAASVGAVVRAVRHPPVGIVYVVDNGSSDCTAAVARAAGAEVIYEPTRGYGAACLAGVRALSPDTEIVVFLDADGSDDPAQLRRLVAPIANDTADFVVGSRSLGRVEPGALSVQQRVGNAIASQWLRRRFQLPATDIGPFRAIRSTSLQKLCMSDADYGWTIEMQIKAAREKLRYAEVPVPYRRRIGRSKISRTLSGAFGAATKIVGLLAWYDLMRPRSM